MPQNLYRRGATYYARFAIHGELQRVSLRTSDIREARARLKAIKKKATDQAFGVEGAASWQDAVTAYIAGVLDAGGVKGGTAKRYRVSLRQLDSHFANKPLPAIAAPEISAYVSARQAEGATNATIKRDLTTMSRVMAFARSKQLVTANPVDAFDRSFVHEQPAVIDAPDEADVAAAAGAMEALGEPELAALIRFLYGTGMRAGEAIQIRRQDIKGRSIQILQTKTSRPRTIEVDPALIPPGAPHGRLFPGLPDNSGDLAGYWQWRRRELPEAQQFRLHDLRHAFAIARLRAGWDIYDLMHHLGHSSIKVTERYLGYVPRVRNSATRVRTKDDTDTPRESTEDRYADSESC